jgi:hypothetical protein
MCRILGIAMLLCVAVPTATTADGVPIGKGIDIGPLAEYFTLLSAEGDARFKHGDASMPWQQDGYRVTLRLRATKDVDTTDIVFRAGFFDKGKHLMQASPMQFEADFPLVKGESINAFCLFKHEHIENGLPWHMIYIRPGKTAK